MSDVYQAFLDAIHKPKGAKTFIKLGDQVLSMEVKKGIGKECLNISTDVGGIQLNQKDINKLFGK